MFSLLRWIAAVVVISGCAVTAFGQQAGVQPSRPRVALALGGGMARGLSHVGVLRWLEEHHIPVDAIAGTSIGGLIGGAYAAGMSPDEIEKTIAAIDWDAMFGASGFRFDHVRRKRDLREYTSRLEFGLKHGIAGPPALNMGEQVGLFLSRITAPYYQLRNFDELPTPFRCIAVDLHTAKPVIMRDGPLARALRATMAMPLTFPPVAVGDQLLVDGGVLNNLPVDVARSMGAAKVIAVNVADLGRKDALDRTLLGLVAESMDSMIRADGARSLAAADIAITVSLQGITPNDWDRADEIIRAGYDAAEAMRDRLLPLAVGDDEWRAAREKRRDATVTRLPRPSFVRIDGAGPSDTERMHRHLAFLQDVDVDINTIERSVNELGGMDRFETVTWGFENSGGREGLVFHALQKANGPPFVFLGATLENTTSNEFRFGIGARYLAFDVLGSGSELRVDGALGSEPGLRASWYRPIIRTLFFIEPVAQASTTRVSIIEDNRITAEYGRRRIFGGVDIGFNPGRVNEFRLGARAGVSDADVRLGDGGLPEIEGTEVTLQGMWTYDTQDDPLLPSRGTHLVSTLTRFLRAPDATAADGRSSERVTKFEGAATWFHPLRRDRSRRIFAFAGAGTSFDGRPFVVDQFSLGGPARLTAFGIGEARGDHYGYLGVGYLHRAFRLPDFLGRSVFTGAWIESGSAFNDRVANADIAVHASATIIADTLIGPIFAGASAGIDGHSRFYVGIGRIFR